MARITWKEGAVISIETRKGVFVLAQMLISPYLMFYNAFREDEEWGDVDLSSMPILFSKSVTKQFLKNSNVTKQPKIKPCNDLETPKYWIQTFPDSRKVTVWKGTDHERSLMIIGSPPGGKLVEKRIGGGFQEEKVIKPSIQLNDNKTIDSHETTGLGIYPEMNERLYLCYSLNRNIDPYKDLKFNRELPLDCTTYIDIISGQVELSKLGY